MRNTPGFIQDIIRPHRAKLALALVLNVIVGASVAFQNVVPKYIIDDALMNPELGPAPTLFLCGPLFVYRRISPGAAVQPFTSNFRAGARALCI
jgi:hypothetical protein